VASSKRLRLTNHFGNCVGGITTSPQVLQPGDRNAVTLGSIFTFCGVYTSMLQKPEHSPYLFTLTEGKLNFRDDLRFRS
jgi:hypothetical protein